MKIYVGIGLAIVAVVLGLTLWSNRGERLILAGSIQKVRLQNVDENTTVAVVEFRLNNPADLPFRIKNVQLILETAKGDPIEGTLFHQQDLDRFFEFNKASLGPRYNDSVRIGEMLKSHTLVDRTIAGSFPVAADEVARRKRLVIRLEAEGGVVPTEIGEKR